MSKNFQAFNIHSNCVFLLTLDSPITCHLFNQTAIQRTRRDRRTINHARKERKKKVTKKETSGLAKVFGGQVKLQLDSASNFKMLHRSVHLWVPANSLRAFSFVPIGGYHRRAFTSAFASARNRASEWSTAPLRKNRKKKGTRNVREGAG